MNRSDKLECYITLDRKSFKWKTLLTNSYVTKKIKCFEYGPWPQLGSWGSTVVELSTSSVIEIAGSKPASDQRQKKMLEKKLLWKTSELFEQKSWAPEKPLESKNIPEQAISVFASVSK